MLGAKVERDKSGLFVIEGVDELHLVNQYPKIKVFKAPGKPKHLTSKQIGDFVKMMKVENLETRKAKYLATRVRIRRHGASITTR
jgi:hypothetical protein